MKLFKIDVYKDMFKILEKKKKINNKINKKKKIIV